MKKKFARRSAAVGAGVLAAITIGGTALADPPAGEFRDLAGVGSDTTQDVLNSLGDNVTLPGTTTKPIASYDATGGGNITTKAPPAACTFPRPVGSGNGVDKLVASRNANDGCVQFARSSSNSASSRTGQGLTFIPFATDAVSYAIRSDSTNSKKLTTAQLTAIYNCSSTTTANFLPLLPAFGSGTRSFFLGKLGFTDAADFTAPGKGHECVKEVDATGATIVENNGLVLTDPKQIIPFSAAQYSAQQSGAASDLRGQSTLGSVNNVPSVTVNPGAAYNRPVYNVVPTTQIGSGTEINQVFVGGTSLVCARGDIITRFGFATRSDCGTTTTQTAP